MQTGAPIQIYERFVFIHFICWRTLCKAITKPLVRSIQIFQISAIFLELDESVRELVDVCVSIRYG